MTNIVIAEDHALIRDGMKLLMMTQPGWCLVGETGDGREVCRIVCESRAALLLLDLDLPGCRGIELVRQVRQQAPHTRILIVTGNQNPAVLRAAIAAGADGYLLKHDDGGELLQAIRDVLAGVRYVSEELAPFMDDLPAADAPAITARERQILALIAGGHTSQTIAEQLHLSVLTVRKHRQNLMSKLSLHSVAEVVTYAIREGLPVPPSS